MVRYNGRAKQRTGSVNTNQIGLKMSGCASTIGKTGPLLTNQTQRSKCNIKFCGDVIQHGVVVKTNEGDNCVPRAPRSQSFNSGVGHINAPRFRCGTNCSADPDTDEHCKLTPTEHPYLSDIEHGGWVYNSFFEMPDYINAAYVWVGDMEPDANGNISVQIYSPATPASNNEDYYVNLFNKKLSFIIDARINGSQTEEDYKPCLYTSDQNKCIPPYNNDPYVKIHPDSISTNGPIPNNSEFEYEGHPTQKTLPPSSTASTSSQCLLWGLKNYASGITISQFTNYSQSSLETAARNVIDSLESFNMIDTIKVSHSSFSSTQTYKLNVKILKRLMDANNVTSIQLDIEPYNFQTKINLNIFIRELSQELLIKPNIELNAFLFPYYINSSDFPNINNFVPIFSCYDLWGPEFGDTFNQVGRIINTLSMYRNKLKILFNHIKTNWNDKKYKLGILGAASVHEYEKYIPPKDSTTCSLKKGYPISQYLEVFFDELKCFWNKNPSIRNNFRGFSVWGWLNAVSYPDPKDKSYRRYYRQNSFLPFQPKCDALSVIECKMKELGVYKVL
jgi:hypothetical protein